MKPAINNDTKDWLIENPIDGSIFVRVESGKVFLGGKEHHLGNCDPFWIEVPEFYLALTPVTNAQYQKYLIATQSDPPVKKDSGKTLWTGTEIPEELLDHPVVNVSWLEAKRYCEWAEARLPTEFEWERAAKGEAQSTFPWGSEWEEDWVRNDKNRALETTASVWSYPEGCSHWGHYQMIGNVWEWCEDSFDEAAYRYYSKGKQPPLDSNPLKVTRGGSWFNVSVESFHSGFRFGFPHDESDFHYGFRLALDP